MTSWAVAGWSCKDLSRMHLKYITDKNKIVLSTKQGTSGGTFDAVLKYLQRDGVSIYIGENVHDLMQMDSNK